MKQDNIIQEKTFAFAIRVVRAYQHLVSKKKEYVLSRQFLRSGTSIGANVEESIGGQSTADFISKLSIAYKEARETLYWIRLMKAANYLTEAEAQSLLRDADEICRILSKILVTSKNKLNS